MNVDKISKPALIQPKNRPANRKDTISPPNSMIEGDTQTAHCCLGKRKAPCDNAMSASDNNVISSLKNAGVNMLCLDFDNTLVSVHTDGWWE